MAALDQTRWLDGDPNEMYRVPESSMPETDFVGDKGEPIIDDINDIPDLFQWQEPLFNLDNATRLA